MNQTNECQKGVRVFYLFPLFYVLSVYLCPVLLLWAEPIGLFLLILPLVLGVVNIVVAVMFCKPENRLRMLHATVLIKYSMIPFFVLGGMFLVLIFLMSFIPVPIPVFLFAIPSAAIGAFVGWLMLALGSPYAISYLYLSGKANIRSKFAVVVHCILQFFFTADVIDVMVLTFKEGKWRKLTLFIIALFVILVIALLAYIFAGILGTLI